MKILLLGKNGQVGWELQRALAPMGEVIALDRKQCDLAVAGGIRTVVRTLRPALIVNAAAYTAVDKAENEADIARAINAEAPFVLATEAAHNGTWLVHYSTDYVFDGSGDRPWRESDPVNPLSVYGQTKLAGERAIQEFGCRHLIFRTSWVFAARGANFVRTILRLANERDRLTVIDDQFGAPTGAELLADVTVHAIRMAMLDPELAGLYHLAAAGEISWHGYACFVLNTVSKLGVVLKAGSNCVDRIPTDQYPTPAKRPLNSRLDTTKLKNTFALQLPPWQTGVSRMLQEMHDQYSPIMAPRSID